MQAAFGTALALLVVVYGYMYLGDPLILDSIHGSMIGPDDLKLYLTGYKRHEDCPGEWHVTLNTATGEYWMISETLPTGIVPEGVMHEIPVQTYFLERPAAGSYTATLNVQYNCLIPFRHQASFELVVP